MKRVLLCVITGVFIVACNDLDMTTLESKTEVEIAPNVWLEIIKRDAVYSSDLSGTAPSDGSLSSPGDDGSTEMEFMWNNRRVIWRGKGIPISLREHNGTLYLITYNRENFQKSRFELFKLKGDSNSFHTIEPKDFPREIASQNMWLRTNGRHTRIGKNMVDTWEALRSFEYNSPGFQISLTAHIWYYLSTGKQYFEQPHSIDSSFLKTFIENHKPVALPTIVREQEEDMANP